MDRNPRKGKRHMGHQRNQEAAQDQVPQEDGTAHHQGRGRKHRQQQCHGKELDTACQLLRRHSSPQRNDIRTHVLPRHGVLPGCRICRYVRQRQVYGYLPDLRPRAGGRQAHTHHRERGLLFRGQQRKENRIPRGSLYESQLWKRRHVRQHQKPGPRPGLRTDG